MANIEVVPPWQMPTPPRWYTGPRVTVAADDWLHSHDDVETLLRYTALGATVVYDPLRRAKRHYVLDASREFTVVMDGAPQFAVNARDLYVLPCKASKLAARVRDLCRIAQSCLAPLELWT